MNKGRGEGKTKRGIRMGSPRSVEGAARCVQTEGTAIVVISPPPSVIISASDCRRSSLSPCMRTEPASTSDGGGPAYASGPRQDKLAAVCTAVVCPYSPSFVIQVMCTACNIHLVAMVCVGLVASEAMRAPRSEGSGKPLDLRGRVHAVCARAGSVRRAAPCRVVLGLCVVQRASA